MDIHQGILLGGRRKRFFIEICGGLEVELLYYEASHYGNVIWDMPIGWAMRLIRKAIEEKAEARAWQLYCSAYPNFTKKNFKTFEQFYPKRKAIKKGKATQADGQVRRYCRFA